MAEYTVVAPTAIEGLVAAKIGTGGALDTGLDARYGRRSALIDSIEYPLYVAHRGGPKLHPEHSVEAYRRAAAGGFPIELDLQSLSDGTLVSCHDSTVDRTMTGVTGAPSTLTLAQWRAATIDPALPGGESGTPAVWDDILDEFGGRVLLMPEIKNTSDATAVINSIVARGLERSVIVQSFSLPDAQQVAAAGLSALYLSDSASPATCAASGIEFVGASTAVSAGYIAGFTAVDIPVIIYTPTSRTSVATQLANGASGVFVDDPWGFSGRYRPRLRLPMHDGTLWPLNGTGFITNSAEPSLTPRGFALSRTIAAGSGSSTCGLRLGQFGDGTIEGVVRFRLRFMGNTASTDRWVGVWLGQQSGDGPYTDDNTTQNGYHVLVRANGVKAIYRKLSGVSTALIASHTSTAFAATTTTVSALLDFTLTITATTVTIRCETDGTEATIADAATRPTDGFLSFLANGASVEVEDVSFARS